MKKRKWVGIWFASINGKIVVGTPKQIDNYRKAAE
jgi:hypothetical protein